MSLDFTKNEARNLVSFLRGENSVAYGVLNGRETRQVVGYDRNSRCVLVGGYACPEVVQLLCKDYAVQQNGTDGVCDHQKINGNNIFVCKYIKKNKKNEDKIKVETIKHKYNYNKNQSTYTIGNWWGPKLSTIIEHKGGNLTSISIDNISVNGKLLWGGENS